MTLKFLDLLLPYISFVNATWTRRNWSGMRLARLLPVAAACYVSYINKRTEQFLKYIISNILENTFGLGCVALFTDSNKG